MKTLIDVENEVAAIKKILTLLLAGQTPRDDTFLSKLYDHIYFRFEKGGR